MFERTGEYSHLRTIPVLTEVAEGAPLEIPVLTETVEAIGNAPAQAHESDSIASRLPPIEAHAEALASQSGELNSGLSPDHDSEQFPPLTLEQSAQFSAGLITRIETWRLDNYDTPADADWPALKQALPELIRAQFAASATLHPEPTPVYSQTETLQSEEIQ